MMMALARRRQNNLWLEEPQRRERENSMSSGSNRIPPVERPWQELPPKLIVGKDILELLSSAMYLEPLSIYREYIQNAADSIDVGQATGALAAHHLGQVAFTFRPEDRTVLIRDNGVGVPADEFVDRLTSFGASTKRGSNARGFRGVGRLGGLGYCQELVFRARAKGESHISEMRWDCRKLKSALRSTEHDVSLQELVVSVVSSRRIPANGAPQHFFEVELHGIVRHRNDQLLDPAAVESYLSQVAPIPFSQEFRFEREIRQALARHMSLGEIEVRVNGAEVPLYRPHMDNLEVGVGERLAFRDLELISAPGLDGEVAAIGWVLHHDYTGALPNSALVKGLRLRVGNIQIGGDRLLEDLFTEARFNSWAVGEVHVLDRRIVPNGRRDHFEQNVHFANLLAQLTPVARDIGRRCRTSSIARNRARDLLTALQKASETLAVVRQGAIPRAEQARLLRDVHAALASAEKLLGGGLLDGPAQAKPRRQLQKIRRELAELEGQSSEGHLAALSRLRPSQRKAYERVFALLYECAPNRTVAKAIVDRILDRL